MGKCGRVVVVVVVVVVVRDEHIGAAVEGWSYVPEVR